MTHITSLTGKQNSVLTGPGYKSGACVLLYIVSLCLHLFIFLLIIVLQTVNSPTQLPPAIRVSLVSFVSESPDKSAPDADKSIEEKEIVKKSKIKNTQKKSIVLTESTRKRAIKSVPDLKAKIKKNKKNEKKSTKSKKSLKQKTYRASKVIASARESIKKDIEKKEKNSLDKAFSRLEEKVSKEGNSNFGVSGKAPSGMKLGRKDVKAIDIYNMGLMYRIQQNWAFNDILAGHDKHLEVRVIVKILKDGKVRDIWVETRSGNRYLDESALRAIKKSIPLPELPRGYSSYDIGLIFTPSGLK